MNLYPFIQRIWVVLALVFVKVVSNQNNTCHLQSCIQITKIVTGCALLILLIFCLKRNSFDHYKFCLIHWKYCWHLDFENPLISFKQCWMKVFLLVTGHNKDHSTNLLKSADSSKRRGFLPSWMIWWCSYQLSYNNFIFLSSLFPVDGVLIQLDTLSILNYNSRLLGWIENAHFCSNKKNKIWCICNFINTYLPT